MNTIFEDAEKYKKIKTTFKKVRKAEDISENQIITLCGSTDFKYEYDRINMLFTLAGNVVLSCGVFRENCSDIEKYRDLLEEVHRRKINMCDMVFILNCNNHIGEHTKAEIEYAVKKHKKVVFLLDGDGNKLI